MARTKRRKYGRDAPYSGQFAGRLVEMLESPAYRVLSLAAHRILARLEIELHHHASYENGKLIVTYGQFVDYGIDRDSIGPAIRECEALGFLEVTERGFAGAREHRAPNKYRLTYRGAEGIMGDGSHEWRRFQTIEEAEAAKATARKAKSERRYRLTKRHGVKEYWRPSKQISVGENRPIPVGETPTENVVSLVGKPRLQP